VTTDHWRFGRGDRTEEVYSCEALTSEEMLSRFGASSAAPEEDARRPPTRDEATELRRLVDVVADFNGHSAGERVLALELALGDPVNALRCFRATAEKIGRLQAKGINGCSTPGEWQAWFAE
jgi:hypothetical protein